MAFGISPMKRYCFCHLKASCMFNIHLKPVSHGNPFPVSFARNPFNQ